MHSSSIDHFVDTVREQLAQGEIELALDRLQNYVYGSASTLRNEVTLLFTRYNRLRLDERKGLTTPESVQVEYNRLVDAILAFLEVMPRRIDVALAPSPSPPLADEMSAIPQDVSLEKILGVNNLKQISWIEKGIHVASSVCRILTPVGVGTGFLIGQDLLMTNHHVVPDVRLAAESVVEFNYQQDFLGNLMPTCRYQLDVSRFHSNLTLDYTIVGVRSDPNKPDLDGWGALLLNANADPVPGEHVVIVQHPNGGLKQIVLTANQVVGLWEHRLHYTTDTMPGSSGAPVFNDSWQVIAIHHAGGNLQTNARGDTRFVNEGVLMSAIKSDAGSSWPQ